MKSVFAEFSSFWPQSSHKALEPMLDQIPFYYFPEGRMAIANAKDAKRSIVVMTQGEVRDIIQLTALGFEHCVQRNRPDFAQELLAAALMVSRPEAFVKNPVPFFFTGFSQSNTGPTETNMTVPFRKTSDKEYLLERLGTFLKQNPKLKGLSDICIQVADELVANALFSSPADFKGANLYQEVDRNSEIVLPELKKATFFACFSDYRVIVGCEDRFGSFKKNHLIDHLENSFLKNKATARGSQSAGAGLGFRYMIENSANFYIYCDKGRRSLVAAGFLLQGLKANFSSQKHFHLSFK